MAFKRFQQDFLRGLYKIFLFMETRFHWMSLAIRRKIDYSYFVKTDPMTGSERHPWRGRR